MTNIEYFEFLDRTSRYRVLNDVESMALGRLVRTKEIQDHMDAKRKAK